MLSCVSLMSSLTSLPSRRRRLMRQLWRGNAIGRNCLRSTGAATSAGSDGTCDDCRLLLGGLERSDFGGRADYDNRDGVYRLAQRLPRNRSSEIACLPPDLARTASTSALPRMRKTLMLWSSAATPLMAWSPCSPVVAARVRLDPLSGDVEYYPVSRSGTVYPSACSM